MELYCNACKNSIAKSNWSKHVKNRIHRLQSKINENEETSEVLCDTCYEKISKYNLARHLQSEDHKLKVNVTE
jgi:hypothetical protein